MKGERERKPNKKNQKRSKRKNEKRKKEERERVRGTGEDSSLRNTIIYLYLNENVGVLSVFRYRNPS